MRQKIREDRIGEERGKRWGKEREGRTHRERERDR